MNVTEEELRDAVGPRPRPGGRLRGLELFSEFADQEQSGIPGPISQALSDRLRVVNDPMVAAYVGMHLWAMAVEAAHSDRVADVRAAFVRQQLESAEGLVKINPKNRHAWRMALVGQANEDFHFEVVYTSPRSVDPQPFPPYRTPEQWKEFVAGMYQSWGNHWGPEPTAASPAP